MFLVNRIHKTFFRFAIIKHENFLFRQINTMCEILKTKYFNHNQQVQLFQDIKLLDHNNKLIGVYTPTEAKKKVAALKKDLVLFNANSNPVICKAMSFRSDIVNRFYNEVILKNKQEVLKKGKQLKVIKLSPNLTPTEIRIKAMQISENTKKYPRIKVTMKSPNADMELKTQEKFNLFKQIVASKVKLIQNYKQQVLPISKDSEEPKQQEDQEQEESDSEEQVPAHKRKRLFSIVLESVNKEFAAKIQKTLKEQPQEAIRNFLKSYIDEDDSETKQIVFKISSNEPIEGQQDDKVDQPTEQKPAKQDYMQIFEQGAKEFYEIRAHRLEQIKNIQFMRRLQKILKQ